MTEQMLNDKVQAYLNDKKVENRLLGFSDEFSFEDVIKSAHLALTEINGKTIYKTNFTIETCDEYLLLLGTARYLLSSAIALKSRNSLAVNDGGTSLNREGNLDLYYRIYEPIRQDFNDQLEAIKYNLNLMNGFGH